MKTTMQQTSLVAYWDFDPKTLSNREREVYEALEVLGAATNLDLVDYLQRPINTITGRTNSLVEKRLVKEAFKAPSKQTGRTAIFWELA